MPFSHLSQILYELEKKSSLVTRALSAKSCARDTDSLHSCTRLRLVQEMACLYHSCKILPRKHSYPNLIPIVTLTVLLPPPGSQKYMCFFCSWTSANIEDVSMHSIAAHHWKESSKFAVRELLSNENTYKYGYQSKHFDVIINESKTNVMQSHELEDGKICFKRKQKQ